MLTLVAVGITLIVGRWMEFKGKLHKWAMPIDDLRHHRDHIRRALGRLAGMGAHHHLCWLNLYHVLGPALCHLLLGQANQRPHGRQGIEKPNFFQKIGALVHDPLKFGSGWQMVFMNFTVSGVGIFMAVKLDEIFRVWPHREERITLTGHWHILAGLIATIILFYFIDLSGLKGKARKWAGWVIIIGSDIAFGCGHHLLNEASLRHRN